MAPSLLLSSLGLCRGAGRRGTEKVPGPGVAVGTLREAEGSCRWQSAPCPPSEEGQPPSAPGHDPSFHSAGGRLSRALGENRN